MSRYVTDLSLTRSLTRWLRRQDAELARDLGFAALRAGFLGRRSSSRDDKRLRISGPVKLDNPVGLAAGFDKDGKAWTALSRLGFGAVEVGTLTPMPQKGNARPRLFCFEEARAIVNAMGFNNAGLSDGVRRMQNRRPTSTALGINLGANRNSDDRLGDYVKGYAVLAQKQIADYVAINLSSPNTPRLRDLQTKTHLASLLGRLEETRAAHGNGGPPLFLKIAPDLSLKDLDDLVEVARDSACLAGVICTNTTTDLSRLDATQTYGVKGLRGGLSGQPLRDLATECLRQTALRAGPDLCLIGVGGIFSGADALEKFRAGASLVQIYTGFVYRGPRLIDEILEALSHELDAEGCASIAALTAKYRARL